MKKFPPISIIIVTLNSERTLRQCLDYIEKQDYPEVSEIIVVDGGSTDDTHVIIKNSKSLPIKIIKGGYKDNQEARRAIGVKMAKNEICGFLDSDNYILAKNWLREMVEPLLVDKEIIATQTLRYAAPKNSTLLNRYFGLIGGADPASYYLAKNDRLSWAFDRWNLLGKVVFENDKYLKVQFDPRNYPTVGCNGILFRRSVLLKSNWGAPENYFHADVFVDVGRLGFNKFGIVKNEIFHNTAENPLSFLLKRRRYMQLHYQKMNKRRRQLVFDSKKPNDIFKLLLFIVFSFTFIEPLWESCIGFIKKKDAAWFLHPIMSFCMGLIYAEATLHSFSNRQIRNK